MILACDIGNTNTKCGIFSNEKLDNFSVISSIDEINDIITDNNIEDIVISSVVPARLEELKTKLPKNIRITEINNNSFFNLSVNYKTPETLGSDRLCSCEGAFFLFKQSQFFQSYDEKTFLISISLGTATTVDFVSYPGIYEGGVIAPGTDLMNNSLHSGTARLPLADTNQYSSFTGKSTMESIASGIINATVGLIERAIWLCKSEMGAENVFVFITGGNAPAIMPYLKFSYIYEKALVLYGINAVSGINIKKK
jgi:type III pantothenate kinase